MAYAVVFFKENKTTSEIPTNWLHEDEDNILCWWPPTHVKNLTSLIAKRVKPDIKTWSLYAVKVEKYCSKNIIYLNYFNTIIIFLSHKTNFFIITVTLKFIYFRFISKGTKSCRT